MSYVRDTVFILKNEPFREHDSRVTMYGRVHGKLAAVARGSRRWGAKQGGHLEPFSVAEVMIAHGASFDKLAVARRVQPVRMHLPSFALCGAFVGLVDAFVHPHVPEAALYDLLIELRAVLADEPVVSADRARFLLAGATLKLLDILGYAPVLEDKILKFMRQAGLEELKRLTAAPETLQAAGAAIEEALRHTPLQREPHGAKTLAALLG